MLTRAFAKFATMTALILLLQTICNSASLAAEANIIGSASSNDYFIAQESISLSGEFQGNEGALASIDSNIVLVVRRLGSIEAYDARTGQVSGLASSVPYTEFPQRSFGERGLTGVKGALFDRTSQNLLVSTVQVSNECARPVLFVLHWSKLTETLGRATKVLSAPTCVPVKTLEADFPAITAENRQSQPNTSQASGRIVKMGQDSYLWSIGNFGDSWRSIKTQIKAASDSNDFYGKTILISKNWKPSIYTSGHRNIQGLVSLGAGNVLASEHGPQGGDELNRLTKSANYGWPSVSLGHNYSRSDGTFHALGQAPSTQGLVFGKSMPPLFSWTPSIAPSQAIAVLDSSTLRSWRGSLLVATLKDQSIRRLVFQGKTVVSDERISVGFRIRDLVWLGDRILCLDDASKLVILRMTPRVSDSGTWP